MAADRLTIVYNARGSNAAWTQAFRALRDRHEAGHVTVSHSYFDGTQPSIIGRIWAVEACVRGRFGHQVFSTCQGFAVARNLADSFRQSSEYRPHMNLVLVDSDLEPVARLLTLLDPRAS